eukprot:CAMPEP_0177248764 /NCGR_PEP_ID=MMETSP0367-20130122/52359_1 /TAXON_ID=447022 ORGANISM="Scrippsiella hangoei-like, Strain SHHI-4" /NCGR_SAMPLE_ID=MMETSP0367 /ASSEMBLY_ACC=CAM_ASM_000362 /LENGTH=67 /DNA_ID=CAMNT_0018701157 /DNA_START=29 /DNA_END=229 /DNA_ORIENTATION=-
MSPSLPQSATASRQPPPPPPEELRKERPSSRSGVSASLTLPFVALVAAPCSVFSNRNALRSQIKVSN